MCRYGRIFLTVAIGAGAAELTPALSFTMEEAGSYIRPRFGSS